MRPVETGSGGTVVPKVLRGAHCFDAHGSKLAICGGEPSGARIVKEVARRESIEHRGVVYVRASVNAHLVWGAPPSVSNAVQREESFASGGEVTDINLRLAIRPSRSNLDNALDSGKHAVREAWNRASLVVDVVCVVC